MVGTETRSVRAEVALAIIRPAEPVHDVGELVAVDQPQCMAKLVKGGQIQDDSPLERVAFDRSGDRHLGPDENASARVGMWDRFPVHGAGPDESHTDGRIGRATSVKTEATVGGVCPRAAHQKDTYS